MNEDDRRDYTALIAVLDERFNTLRDTNQREHETILRKIEVHNGFAVKLSEIVEYCDEIKSAKLRERVKALEVYLAVGIAIVLGGSALFGFFIQHTLGLLAKKLEGG